MKTDKNEVIRANWHLPLKDISLKVGLSVESVRKRGFRMNLPPHRETIQNKKLPPQFEMERDLVVGHLTEKQKGTALKYKFLQKRNEELQRQVNLIKIAKEITTYEIPKAKGRDSEATAVVLASDFHSEELVRADSVSGLNEFDLDTANQRIVAFFQNVARLIEVRQKSIEIKRLVLALLGDFITGAIHEEIETLLEPAEAIVCVQNHIASGIEFLLKNTNVEILIPCHSGNHGRQTHRIHQGNEHGNSNEYLMFHMLSNHFRGEKRVKFLIAKSYHSYMDIAGFKIRFHHGHNIKYNGGIGGITISVNKAIAQWNKANNVDLDCFGHFHQLRYGGNFVCNGSLIGYNAFGVSIKADYEKPKQAFFLINHERKEVTDFGPVWLD